MYEAHFGLSSRPFGSKAEGADVFSGPRQVETMTNLKKGLSALDAVVAITGPVGVGKTTVVSRALDTITPNRMAAWVGRMQLAPDEVLQLLLAGFGLKAPAKGTIQRFAVFRRLLAERAAAGAPVAIVVEDAHRLGVDALVELEALTAADTGDATSANIILMGQPDLKKLLAQPDLARLNQRTRLRQAIEPLSQPEVNGYLKHCIRVANGDYDKIFEAGVAEIVYACSEGIPRMINTLCESALTAAIEDGLKTVSAALMHKVAIDAFGYEGPLPEIVADTPSEDSVDVPIIEIKAEVAEEVAPKAGDTAAEDAPDIDWEKPPASRPVAAPANESEDELPLSARNIVVESGRYPELPEIPEDSPLAADAELPADSEPDPQPVPDESGPDGPDLSELINDTQPELTTLKVPQTDEPVAAALEVDTESTAIQEQLPESAIPEPEPEPEPVAKETEVETTDGEPAAADVDADSDDGDSDGENFDLDAALSFDTDSTNVMEGITPNFDGVAAESKSSSADKTSEPDLDDLPTLTDSMQVDVDKKVVKANQQDPESGASAPESQSTNDATKNSQVKTPEPAKGSTTTMDKPAQKAAAKPAPEVSKKQDDAPEVVPDAKVPVEATQEAPPPATADLKPETEPEVTSEPDVTPELAKPAKAAKPKKPAAPRPVAQVSEMTARIAALDPENRSNDVESLEAALDAAKTGQLEKMMAPPPLPEVTTEEVVVEKPPAPIPEIAVEEPPAPIPEITLDDKIASKPAPRPVPAEHLAEIGQAQSLEEFSDALAETLFGNEDLDQIAAAVVANPPPDTDANAAHVPESVPSIEPPAIAAELTLAVEEPIAEKTAKEEPAVVAPVAKPAVTPPPVDGGLRESQQMRADMLQSLNTDKKPARSKPAVAAKVEIASRSGAEPAPGQKKSQPESIENQINTSITQTLEALDVAKMAENTVIEEEEKEEKKGGLFSRFRKSS